MVRIQRVQFKVKVLAGSPVFKHTSTMQSTTSRAALRLAAVVKITIAIKIGKILHLGA
jgi:hypothetical protein